MTHSGNISCFHGAVGVSRLIQFVTTHKGFNKRSRLESRSAQGDAGPIVLCKGLRCDEFTLLEKKPEAAITDALAWRDVVPEFLPNNW